MSNMEREIWLPIKGFEGLYEVSSFGRVRSLNYHRTGQTKVLSPYDNGKGYLKVDLCKKGTIKKFKVHRLVAQAFIPNWFYDQQINHIDEDKHNNNIYNLEWCDSKYNNNHGTRNRRISEKLTNGKLSKPVLQLSQAGELIKEWPSIMEAERNGFNKGNISSCCSGRMKSYKGYIWRYKSTYKHPLS